MINDKSEMRRNLFPSVRCLQAGRRPYRLLITKASLSANSVPRRMFCII